MEAIIEILVVPVCAGIAGITIMLAAELLLFNFAQAGSFTFQAGRYNLRSAQWPHVLRGSHRDHDVTIMYSLGHYFAEGENRGISTITYAVPPHPKVHLRVAPRRLFERKAQRSGVHSFDNWVTVRGGPKAFVQSLLSDESVRTRLKATISPTFTFTSTLSMAPAGPLVLRHKSMFLSPSRIEMDLELLGDIAAVVDRHLQTISK